MCTYATMNVTMNTTADVTIYAITIIITEDARHIYINIYIINCYILMQIDDSDSLNQNYSE